MDDGVNVEVFVVLVTDAGCTFFICCCLLTGSFGGSSTRKATTSCAGTSEYLDVHASNMKSTDPEPVELNESSNPAISVGRYG